MDATFDQKLEQLGFALAQESADHEVSAGHCPHCGAGIDREVPVTGRGEELAKLAMSSHPRMSRGALITLCTGGVVAHYGVIVGLVLLFLSWGSGR